MKLAPVISNKSSLHWIFHFTFFSLSLVSPPLITRLHFAVSNRETTRNVTMCVHVSFHWFGAYAHTGSPVHIHISIYLFINDEYARHVNLIYNLFYSNEESVFFCFHSHPTTLLYYIFSLVFFCILKIIM